MNKMFKRLLSFMVALVMVFSMVPAGVFHGHVHAAETPDLSYSLVAYDDLLDNGLYSYRTNGGRTESNATTSDTTYNKLTPEITRSWITAGLMKEAGYNNWEYVGYTGQRTEMTSGQLQMYKASTNSAFAIKLKDVPAGIYTATIYINGNIHLYAVPASEFFTDIDDTSKYNTDVASFLENKEGYVGEIAKGNHTDEFELDFSAGGDYVLVFTGSAETTASVKMYTLYLYKQESGHTHDFTYQPATCTEPAACSCGVTEGEALGHDWAAATVDAPKTCNRCSTTEGSSLARASITVDGVTTNYASLQEAINAVQEGETIVLQKDNTINEAAVVEGFDNKEGYGLVINTQKSFTIRLAGKDLTLNTDKGIYINTSSTEEGAEQKTVSLTYGPIIAGESCMEAIVVESTEGAVAKTKLAFNTQRLTTNAENCKAIVLKDADLTFTSSDSGNCKITNNAGGYNIWAEGQSSVVNNHPTTMTVTGEGSNIYLADDEAQVMISNGTFSSAVAEEYCAEGYIPIANDDGTYGVKKGKYVIRNTTTGVGYESLADAIAAVGSGDTIKLMADIAVDSTMGTVTVGEAEASYMFYIPAGAEVTIDLNGHSIVSSAAEKVHVFLVQGTLTLTDTAEIKGVVKAGPGGGSAVRNLGGNVTLQNGVVLDSDNVTHYTVYTDGGTLTIEDADVYDGFGAVQIVGGAVATIEDGNFYRTEEGDNAEVNQQNIVYVEAATLTINGGNFEASTTKKGAAVVGEYDATITINDGYFAGPTMSVQSRAESDVTIYKGTFVGPFSYGGDTGPGVINNYVDQNTEVVSLSSGIATFALDSTGGTTYYVGDGALAEAIAAAQDGDIIALESNIELSETVVVNKSVTLDLNGKTITSAEDWPANDKYNEGLLSVARGSHLVIEDSVGSGVIDGAALNYAVSLTRYGDSETGDAAVLTVNGGKLIGNWYAVIGNGTRDNTEITINGGELIGVTWDAIYHPQQGTLTINGGTLTGYSAIYMRSGSLAITAINGGTLIGKNDGALGIENIGGTGYQEIGAIAVSGGTFITYSEEHDAVYSIDGSDDGSAGRIVGFITGGTYNTQIAEDLLAEGYILVDNGDGTYSVEAGEYVARNTTTGVGYKTLAEAIEAANSGDTIVLLGDAVVSTRIDIYNKEVTLDLNGKKVTPAAGASMTAGIIRAREGATLVIDDTVGGGEIHYNGETKVYNAVGVIGPDATLIVNGGTLTGYYYGVTGNGSYDGTTIVVNGGKICAVEATGSGIYHPQTGTLTVTGGEISGATGIYFKSGEIEITGGKIIGNGAKVDYGYVASGADATGDALVIENVGGVTGYAPVTSVSITGGIFESANGSAVASYAATGTNPDAVAVTGFVSGGTFNTAVSEELCAEGYIPADNGDGTYGVKVGKYVAQIGTTKYESLQAALDAAAATTNPVMISLLSDVELTETAVLKNKVDGYAVVLSTGSYKVTGSVSPLISVENTYLSLLGATIVSSAENGTAIKNAGMLTVPFGTNKVEAANGGKAIESTGTLVIDVGDYHGAVVATEGYASINGGNFYGTVDMAEGVEGALGEGCTIMGGTYYVKPEAADIATDYVIDQNDDGTWTVRKGVFVAQVGETKYESLAEALAQGGEVKLLKDLVVTESVVITKDVTLNLNGYTISAASTLKNAPVIRVVANVTVKGGTVDGTTGINSYAFIVGQGTNEGTLTIENGEYKGITSVISVTKGTTTIKGGKFSTAHDGEGTDYGTQYLLNCMDDAYKAGEAGYVITGGEFVDFNPMKNAAEGANTNFMAGNLHAADENNDGIFTIHTSVAGEVVVENNVAPDCTEDGSYDNVVYCTVCGEELSRETITVDALGHTEDNGTVTTEPTYNEEGIKTFKCSVCGETLRTETLPVKEGAVAEVNGVKYGTLADAIANADEGETVKLLGDASGAGAVINKNITIDFGGHTYTLTEGVGSGNLTSNGFQILKGNEVTLKDGTLEVAEANKAQFYTLIQNYADLTVEGMTLYGTNLDKWSTTDGDSYVLSVNSGNVVVKDTKIIANDQGDLAYALDSCKKGSYAVPTVTLSGSTDIQGKAEVTGGTLNVTGNASVESVIVSTGALNVENSGVAEINAVAQIGNTYYGTLAEAVAVGGEIKLLANVETDAAIEVSKTVVLELNGYSVSTTENDKSGDGVFHVVSGGDLTINGEGTINGVGGNDYNIAIWADGGKVTINGGTYTNVGATDSTGDTHFDLIYVKNGGEVVINGGKFVAENPAWTLNSHDTAKGTITVYGGYFKGFDPANNAAEGAGTNFLADQSKHTKLVDGYYTVCECTETVVKVENEVAADYNNAGSYDNVTYCTECGKELSRETIPVPMLKGVASVNGVNYGTLAEAIEAAEAGDTIVLIADVEVTALVKVNKNVTIDLGEYDITRTTGDGTSPAILVSGANVTITGTTGTVTANGPAVWAYSGNVTIKGGNYVGGNHAVYASGNSAVVIEDGKFSITDTEGEGCYVLNILDADRATATITVYGGTFVGFNPMDNAAEGADTNFMAVCYHAVASGDSYIAEKHAPTHVEAAEADCTTAGNSEYWACEECGRYYADADGATEIEEDSWVIDALGHSYNGVYTDPTYDDDGYTTYTCSNCGDSYVEVDEGTQLEAPGVAYIETNGNRQYFETVAAAMMAAKSGDKVMMAKDHTEMFINVVPGVTLDLNGYTLSATMVYGLGEIKGDGLLKAPQGNVTLKAQTDYVPVWNEVDGYFFTDGVDMTTRVLMRQYTQNTELLELVFMPVFDDEELKALMIDGSTDNGLTLTVRLSWTGTNGTAEQDFTYKDEWFDDVYAGTKAFNLVINNYADLANLTYTILLVSDTGAEIAGATGSYSLNTDN